MNGGGVRDHLQSLLNTLDLKDPRQHDAAARAHQDDIRDTTGAECSPNAGDAGRFDTERVSRLEQRLAVLEQENIKLGAALDAEQQAHTTDVAELQRRLSTEVQQVVQRQEMVEKQGPVMSVQIEQVKKQLGSLVISHARYHELQSLAPDQRSLADEVRLCMHDGLLQLTQENEALRVSAQAKPAGGSQASHEAHRRLEHDVTALRHENARLQAAAGDASAAADSDVGALTARIDRLNRDLDQANVAAEVNQAKVALYDELEAHAREVEQRNSGLLAVEVENTALNQEDREHRLEILAMDNAFMKRENEALEGRLAAAVRERDAVAEQLQDAKQRHDSICHKLLEGNDTILASKRLSGAKASTQAARVQSSDGQSAGLERRVEAEVRRVQEQARADLAALRTESQSSLERETRLLRDMRDAAQVDGDRLKGELKDCRIELDDVTLRYRTLQRKADVDGSALAAEVKLRVAEAERAQVRTMELDEQCRQIQAQNDLLHDKVRLLTDSFYSLESEHTRTVADLQSNLRGTREQLSCYVASEVRLDKAIEPGDAIDMKSVTPPALPESIKCRMDQASALAGRCADLEQERGVLMRKVGALEQDLKVARRELCKHEAARTSSAGPNSYLMQELRCAEAQARTAEAAAADSHATLQCRTRELLDSQSKMKCMQQDLQAVLEQRAVLHSVKSGLRASMAQHDRALTSLDNHT